MSGNTNPAFAQRVRVVESLYDYAVHPVTASAVSATFATLIATDVLSYLQGDQVRLYEDTTKFGVDQVFVLSGLAGATNHIQSRFTTTDTPCSGAIHWHIHWAPLSDEGFVWSL